MRWLRERRVMGILLIFLALLVYVIMIGGILPLLWPYRDHPLVWVLLAFLSGGHLEELFQETGSWLLRELPWRITMLSTLPIHTGMPAIAIFMA
jgi:hypothetical protein